MITTNVDRTIELLEEKGKSSIKDIAKTLGAKEDSIDLILTYLEEEGLVELKYGVTKTIASLKKKEVKKLPVKKEKKPAKPPEEKQKPKPVPVAKPVPVPEKPILVPRFDETIGTRMDRMGARLTNMIIELFEKFPNLSKEEVGNATVVYNDILNLARESNVYTQRSKVTSEFMLCSILISMGLLIREYEEKKDVNTAKKIYSTYHMVERFADEIDKTRLEYYTKQVNDIYETIMRDIYPKLKLLEPPKPVLKPVEEKKPEEEKPVLPKPQEALPSAVIIPRIDEKAAGKRIMTAKLTNAIIVLLERFYALPKDKQADAILVLNDILRLAKENKLYAQKDAMSAEFILCSLLMSTDMLVSEYERNKNTRLANKIHSTYHLMRDIAMRIDRARLNYYKGMINSLYARIIKDIYPAETIQ